MDNDVLLLVAVVGVALLFDMMNGFHDGANAVSTVIYTGALPPKVAIGISAFFNFIGPLVIGVAVAQTIGGVVEASEATAHLVIAAMLGALLWDTLTWIWALPVSSSHALVGGLLGAGFAGLGLDGINMDKVALVMASLLVSPFLGILTGFILMKGARAFFHVVKMDLRRADSFYKHMQILSSSWVSFSHGSNDATKVMGIIIIFLAANENLSVSAYVDEFGFPLWVILSAASAMALGTYLSVRSFRLIRTMGERITHLHPINGFSAVGAADRMAMRPFTLPEEINDKLLRMAGVCVEAVERLRDAIRALDESFRKAIEVAGEVDAIEGKADRLCADIYTFMFEWDTDFKTFHQLKSIIDRLESVADRAAENAELIRHMSLEYLE